MGTALGMSETREQFKESSSFTHVILLLRIPHYAERSLVFEEVWWTTRICLFYGVFCI